MLQQKLGRLLLNFFRNLTVECLAADNISDFLNVNTIYVSKALVLKVSTPTELLHNDLDAVIDSGAPFSLQSVHVVHGTF